MILAPVLLTMIAYLFCDEPVEDDCDHAYIAPRDQIAAKFKETLEQDEIVSSHDADETTAVAIEWVRLRDSATHGRMGRKADYFLGYISGRIRVTPPEWWCREFRRGGASPEGQAFFNCNGIERLWKGDEDGWQFSGFDRVHAPSGGMSPGLILELDELTTTLAPTDFPDVTDEAFAWNHEDDGAIAGTACDGKWFVIFNCPTSSGPEGPRTLYCLDQEATEIIWKQEILASSLRPFGIGGAVNGSYTQLSVDEDRVIVWMGQNFSMGFEVFQITDGKSIVRFATEHLDGIHLGKK